MLLILHCKRGFECQQSKKIAEKLRASFICIREEKDFIAFLATLWDREMLVWGIWDFFVLKKIKDRNRFFHPGGGDSHMKQTGMLVGNFEFNP